MDDTNNTNQNTEEQIIETPASEEVVETDTQPAEETVEVPEPEISEQSEDQTEIVEDAEVADENTAGDGEEVSSGEAAVSETSEELPAETEPAGPATEESTETEEVSEEAPVTDQVNPAESKGKWYVVHTYSGHENKVKATLEQRIASEHLEHKIFEILVPTQDKIEIRGGKKEQVKEKIFPGYLLVKMDLDDVAWLAVRTTPGVTAFVGMGNKPTPIPESEVKTIVQFMTQGAPATFKDVFLPNDTVKIVDGPFSEFIGKVDSVDKERGKVRVLVSIFGRETPVELDFLQVSKL